MQSFDGKAVVYPDEHELHLFTYKEIFGGQSRTVSNYAGQMALMPENFIYVSAVDADRLQIGDGDRVRLVSSTFGGRFEVGPGQNVTVEGHVKVVQGIRPGSVAISWHYGHWAYGARDFQIDGVRIPGEAVRGTGLVANPAMGIDGYLKDVCLTDPIAGDSAFGGSRIKLVKVASAATESIAMPSKGYYTEGPRLALATRLQSKTREAQSEGASAPVGLRPLTGSSRLNR
jgi:tetrathionate reductase subunit A